VPPDKAGLAASLVSTSQQLGGALGLAIFSAIATSRTNHLLVATLQEQTRSPRIPARVGRRSIFLAAAAIIALRATNTRGEAPAPALGAIPDPAVHLTAKHSAYGTIRSRRRESPPRGTRSVAMLGGRR